MFCYVLYEPSVKINESEKALFLEISWNWLVSNGSSLVIIWCYGSTRKYFVIQEFDFLFEKL
jgi:hypothetical protein